MEPRLVGVVGVEVVVTWSGVVVRDVTVVVRVVPPFVIMVTSDMVEVEREVVGVDVLIGVLVVEVTTSLQVLYRV